MSITRTTTELVSIQRTGTQMGRLAQRYASDMSAYGSWTIERVQELIRNIPYVADPVGEEAVHRPLLTLRGWGIGRDCDDKAICIGAWAHLNGLPFRFVAVGRGGPNSRVKYHHVFCEINFPSIGWRRVDATYPTDRIGELKTYLNRCVIFTTEAKP